MEFVGKTLLGKYEIEGLLGQGGMGSVWRARHALTGRKLAVKLLDESFVGNESITRRFLREARAASTVAHPGIVEVLDIDETEEGLPFLVMEFLEGETLARRIERRGRLGEEELVRLGVMLLEALEAAHAHKVIHRDLKPENIYVVPAGRRGEIIKILDFGISHMQEEGQSKLTMTGSVLGTPHYMSPEQAMGESGIDHRADLYAAGIVLYECAVGDVPFDAPNYNKLLRLILDETPAAPRERGAEISESVERLILWAMEKERDDRIPTAHDMLDWLKRAAKGETVPYQRATPRRSREPTVDLDISVSGETMPAPESDGAAKWEIGEELKSGDPTPRPRTPGLAVPAPVRTVPAEELELELDATALARPARPAATSTSGQIAAVGTASSSGRHRAQSGPVSGSHSISPAAASAQVAPRRMSGGFERPALPLPPEVEERPAWHRYALYSGIGVVLFLGLVFLLRWVVNPTVPDPVTPSPPGVESTDPVDEPPNEQTPRWVSLTVLGLPPQARMQLDGLPATSPLRLRRSSQHVITIEAEGYEGRRIEVTADRNRTIYARLRPAIGAGR